MTKKRFSTELAYFLGLLLLAFGTALMEKAGFGISMVVAPAYLLHLKLSPYLPFFTFGMAEYTLQALLICVMMLVLRRAKLAYLFSLVTAVLYGFMLDGMMALVALIPFMAIAMRVVYFAVGMLICAAAIAFLFRSYISPEAYELFVKEVSDHFGFDIHKCKLVYDTSSLALSVVLSFSFFGLWQFNGIHVGTLINALCNGLFIKLWSHLYDRIFRFEDLLPLHRFFS